MSVFKRRKPGETETAPGAPPISEERLAPTFGAPPATQTAARDDDLSVPPFRPVPPPGAAAVLPPVKEIPTMGRSPFAPAQPPVTPAQPAPGAPRPAPAAVAAPAPAAVPAPLAMPGLPARPAREPADRRTLVVGRGISVQGVVQDAERLVVEGTVEATMIHATELSISPGGVFKGEVEVEEAEVAGTIDGTLTARASLMVRATGRVLGTARCRRLQVEDGGQITGRIEMLSEGAARPAPAPSHDGDTGPAREAAE